MLALTMATASKRAGKIKRESRVSRQNRPCRRHAGWHSPPAAGRQIEFHALAKKQMGRNVVEARSRGFHRGRHSIALEKSAVGSSTRWSKSRADPAVEVTEQATSYLVALLTEFAHPNPRRDDASVGRSRLAARALAPPGAERFQRLRALGDGTSTSRGSSAITSRPRGDVGYITNVGVQPHRSAGLRLRRPAAAKARSERPTTSLPSCRSSSEGFVHLIAFVGRATLAQQQRASSACSSSTTMLRSGSATLGGARCTRHRPVRGSGGVH